MRTNIYTTDLSGPPGSATGDYNPSFGGTSVATPCVAGVAALLLSVNPNLTYEEVRKYLMLGCDKVGDYSYNYSEKYGTWDTEVGYGKVNAFKTLQYALGSERFMNNLNGIVTNTTTTYTWELLNSIYNLAAGVYYAKRYEIQRIISHSADETIIATANGLSPDNPNAGNLYVKLTGLSATSTMLTTYVYELVDYLGRTLGYKPVEPQYLRFNVRLLKKMEKDLYLQNTIIPNQTANFEATNHIETQNVTISGSSIVNFHSGNTIAWKDGTTISPGDNGIVRAYIDPFILGDCEPNHYLSSKNNSLMSITAEEFIVENEYTNVEVHPFGFKLYPNPNTGTFHLETNFPLSDIANLKILNLLGAVVYETQELTSNTIQLQTSATGTFFVVIMLKDGAVVTQKMVVQR